MPITNSRKSKEVKNLRQSLMTFTSHTPGSPHPFFMNNCVGAHISNTTTAVMQVENGKGAMPAWDGRLSEDEIESVSAYVYDKAANDSW
jgi:hypothetical protein